MDIAYFKRYRMEIRLADCKLSPPLVPPPYRLLPWDDTLLDAFSQAKYLSFRDEIDADVFPCLAEFVGCRRLMAEIVRKPGFLPKATWLAVRLPNENAPEHARPEFCGTIQGIRDQHGLGAIQNVGVAPEYRRLGLGTCLLTQALAGFRQAGVQRVYLEVTAKNHDAIRLYQRVGFTTIRTVYKAVEAEYTK